MRDLRGVKCTTEVEELGTLVGVIFDFLKCDVKEVLDPLHKWLIHEGIHLLLQVFLIGLHSAACVLINHFQTAVLDDCVLHDYLSLILLLSSSCVVLLELFKLTD